MGTPKKNFGTKEIDFVSLEQGWCSSHPSGATQDTSGGLQERRS